MSLQRPIFFQDQKIHSFPPVGSGIYGFDYESVTDLKNLNVLCLIYPRYNLEGEANSISCFQENKTVVPLLGLKQYATPTTKLFNGINHVVSSPKLFSVPLTSKAGGGSGGGGGGGGDDDGGGDKKSKKKKKKEAKKAAKIAAHQTTFKHNGRMMNRVEVGVEDILDLAGMVIGWRFWYFIIDRDNVDVMRGLVQSFMDNCKMFANNKAILKRIQGQDPPLEALLITSADEYISDVIGPYRSEDRPIAANDVEALGGNLTSYKHPCHLNQHLNFMNSCKMIKYCLPNADPMFSDPNYYLDVSDYEDRIMFPGNGIRMLLPRDRRPAVMHHALLIETPQTREPLSCYSENDRDMAILDIQNMTVRQGSLYYNGDRDIFKQIRKINMEENEDALKRGVMNAVRYSPMRIDRWRTVCAMYANMDPGSKACAEWMEEQKMKARAEGKRWSAMRVNLLTPDPKMSRFATYIARCAEIFENVFGFGTLHQEMVFMTIWRLSAFDSRPGALHPHLLNLGPAGGGKSQTNKVVKQISIDKTYKESQYDTAKAFTTDMNFNDLLIIYDEMTNQMMSKGENGEGDPLMKSMLSSSIVRVQTIVINPENGRREFREVVCFVSATFLANINANEDDLPEPIVSRFLTQHIAKYERAGVDHTLKDGEIRANPKHGHLLSKAIEEFQLIEALTAKINKAIATGFITEVYELGMLLRWNQIKADLASNGLIVEPRRDSHVLTIARNCAIVEAILHVWCSTEVFPKDKEWEEEDILAVQPFLYITEEHLIYTITAMEQSIMDCNTDQVLFALHALCKNPNVETDLYPSAQPPFVPKEGSTPTPEQSKALKEFQDNKKYFFKSHDKKKGDYDFNFYQMTVSGGDGIHEVILNRMATSVGAVIRKKYKKTVLASSIKRSLKMMMNQSIECKGYKSLGPERDDNVESRPVIHLNTQMLKSEIWISRAFIDKAKGRKDGLMVNAILETQDKNTVRRKLITGKTFRDNDAMFPYLFKTIQCQPNLEKDTKVINLKYKSPGSEYIFDTTVEEDDQTALLETMAKEFEKQKMKEFADKVRQQIKDEENIRKMEKLRMQEAIARDKLRKIGDIEAGLIQNELSGSGDSRDSVSDELEEIHRQKSKVTVVQQNRYVVLNDPIDKVMYDQFRIDNQIPVHLPSSKTFPIHSDWNQDGKNGYYPEDLLVKAMVDSEMPLRNQEDVALYKKLYGNTIPSKSMPPPPPPSTRPPPPLPTTTTTTTSTTSTNQEQDEDDYHYQYEEQEQYNDDDDESEYTSSKKKKQQQTEPQPKRTKMSHDGGGGGGSRTIGIPNDPGEKVMDG